MATEQSPSASAPPVYVIDGARTPFLQTGGRRGPFTPVDLAVQCGRALLLRQPFAPRDFDQVILGCVNVIAEEMNPARVAALRLGMGEAMPAYTVQVNCGSGMQSIDSAAQYIRNGHSDLILAGGTEALSHSPLLYSQAAVKWFSRFQGAGNLPAKLAAMLHFRPGFLKPQVGLAKGLTDPIVDLNMGQTAEVLAHLFKISRERADEYALSSHQRLAHAQEQGWLDNEVVAAITPQGKIFRSDDGVRADNSLEALGKLKPVFERPYGKVTAGNSSQITDGASWVILASEQALLKYNLTPRAVIVDSHWAALDPQIMGLGPVLAGTALLKRHSYSMQDIDLWELNEAFAAQVLACQAAWDDADFSRRVLGLERPLGRIDHRRLNIDGGGISLGHPVAASGNRIVLHLINALHRNGLKRGIATECIGGGQAGAMLIETV